VRVPTFSFDSEYSQFCMRVLQTLMAFAGNAPPQLAVTRRLIERGHEVRVLAHRAARQRVQSTGAEFVEFRRSRPDFDITRRETDSLRDWEARTRLGAGMRSLRNALFAFVGNVSHECADLLDSRPADAMVFDWMLPGAAIAAEQAGLPAVEIVHCPYPLPVEGVPPLFTGNGLQPLDGPLGATRDRLLNRIARRVYDTGLPALNRARLEHGLAPLEHWEDQLLGADTICMMTAPELDFSSRGELPANVRYVGPAFEPHPHEWSSPWPVANTNPLVVVSFSTSYMNQSALAQRVLDALAGLPVRALLTAGPALEQRRLSLPANARAVDFLPHRTVFPHASLVISHAGWQTVNAALADGVPLLCIPGRPRPARQRRARRPRRRGPAGRQANPAPQAPQGDRNSA